MSDYIHNIAANFWLAFGLYWLPLAVCFYGYTIRTWKNYQKDVAAREFAKYYSPTDTIGTLLGRAIVAVFPIANLLAAVFDVGPKIFSKFIDALGKIFDQPLVPKKTEPPK